jgi:dTDP-4-dehydrorhamnose 3,5-epimerase
MLALMQVLPLQPIADGRGTFMEVYRREWLPADVPDMLQSNVSRSKAGVLRGPHFHRRQADYWVVIQGRAFVGLVDLREGSATEGERRELTLDADDPVGLYIPPGVAHGFYAETDLILQYLVDAYYDGADEFGIAWDDPDLGIGWPTTDPTLSSRDRANPSMAEVLAGPAIVADPR